MYQDIENYLWEKIYKTIYVSKEISMKKGVRKGDPISFKILGETFKNLE